MVLQCRHWNYGPLSASSLSNIAALEYTVFTTYQHEQAHASKSSETRPIRVSIHHEGPSTPLGIREALRRGEHAEGSRRLRAELDFPK